MAYNGWKNKDTWLVNVWWGDYFLQIVEEEERSLSADELEQMVEEFKPDLDGFWSDILNLFEPDWHELAEHYQYDGGEEDA